MNLLNHWIDMLLTKSMTKRERERERERGLDSSLVQGLAEGPELQRESKIVLKFSMVKGFRSGCECNHTFDQNC
jgi:hypothetical protein